MEPQQPESPYPPKQPEPMIGEVRTITWMKGRHNSAVTWDLGKLGVVAREATERPAIGETWTVRVLDDTSPGSRKGVLVLEPIEKVEALEQEQVVDEAVVLAALSVVQLAANVLAPGATVESTREGRYVRVIIRTDGDTRWLFGYRGTVLAALRETMGAMLLRGGLRGWLDYGDPPPYAKCSCGLTYANPTDFDMRTNEPAGMEERFEHGAPALYVHRTCGCGAVVYAKVEP